MRLNKNITINKYISMKCCWNSIAIMNQPTSTSSFDNEISEVDIEYLNFDVKKFEHKILGEGHNGKCYKIIMDNKEYTCKKINSSKNSKFYKEVKILKNLTSTEYLPEYFNSFSNLNYHYILYNYIEGEDLYQSLQNGFIKKGDKTKCLTIIKNITDGLFELFNNNLVHLDIKLENIILTNKDPIKIKIIDLETSRKINNNTKKIKCGTPGYASPEILLQKSYYYNTDVWSVGVILFMLFTHYNFIEKEFFTTQGECLNFFENYNEKFIKKRFLMTECFDQDIFELLKLMLHKLHVYRISIHGLIKHKLICSIQQDK